MSDDLSTTREQEPTLAEAAKEAMRHLAPAARASAKTGLADRYAEEWETRVLLRRVGIGAPEPRLLAATLTYYQTTAQIAERAGVAPRAASSRMRKLFKLALVEQRHEWVPGGRFRSPVSPAEWRLTGSGRASKREFFAKYVDRGTVG